MASKHTRSSWKVSPLVLFIHWVTVPSSSSFPEEALYDMSGLVFSQHHPGSDVFYFILFVVLFFTRIDLVSDADEHLHVIQGNSQVLLLVSPKNSAMEHDGLFGNTQILLISPKNPVIEHTEIIYDDTRKHPVSGTCSSYASMRFYHVFPFVVPE